MLANNLSTFDFNQSLATIPAWNPPGGRASQTDLPRLRAGLVGAQFWAAYANCSSNLKDAVSRTIEQIDLIKRIVQLNANDMQLVTSVAGIREAFTAKRIASLIGVEGGHSIDTRLSVLRTLYDLGARYLTLTHNCHLPWVESNMADTGLAENQTLAAKKGISEWGLKVVAEMNRLGMMVDLSHTSKQTQLEVLAASAAPVIFSHSSANGVHAHRRNVDNDVLALVVSS